MLSAQLGFELSDMHALVPNRYQSHFGTPQMTHFGQPPKCAHSSHFGLSLWEIPDDSLQATHQKSSSESTNKTTWFTYVMIILIYFGFAWGAPEARTDTSLHWEAAI